MTIAPTRRQLLTGTSLAALVGTLPACATLPGGRRPDAMIDPVPAEFVTLKPSIFADAIKSNRAYLLSLDPERLLHNFYRSAGLPAPKPHYGGWEAMGIAGHSLGHWLSGCSLLLASGNDPEIAATLDHALSEMARIQAAHGDGYCAGTTVERDGETVDGKIVFEEVRQGKIFSNGFDLNGGWVPLYTWHKVHAGLLHAHSLAGNPRALPIALALAGYLAGVLEPLDDAQMQTVLAAEHGGLNESYADTYALTGNPRWLRMAEKIRHKAVLDPLAEGRDNLEGLHANTQIPKLIGLARLHEVTGNARHARTARFFHERVTDHHSYAIGGNSEREHFGPPDILSTRISESTCEACNSYNMLKLTRHLYRWDGDARWFDIYERIQLNHIMAHQRPDSGQFVYFMPLSAGARRSYSTDEESFWCCVGSGMESHAKHADSIYWHDRDTVYVNLFIPSALDWPERELAFDLDTAMPMEGRAKLTIRRAGDAPHTIAVRLPSWADGPAVRLNGELAPFEQGGGYARITRRWKAGDTIAIDLPMTLRTEPTPDDPSVLAFANGPLILAADLGSAADPFDGTSPAILSDGQAGTALTPSGGTQRFQTQGALGETLTFAPFFNQYDRRTAVYVKAFSPAAWRREKQGYLAAQAESRDLAARTVDIVYLGEMQPERDHGFAASRGETVQLHGRSARKLHQDENIRLTLRRRPGPAVLRLTFWGGDIDRQFTVAVDGTPFATVVRGGPGEEAFVSADYPLPSAGEQGRGEAVITFQGLKGDTDIYEVRMMSAANLPPLQDG